MIDHHSASVRTDRKRPSVIALVQLPPPMHGAAAMNLRVVESKLLNENFDIETIPIQLSTSQVNIGSLSPGKLLRVAALSIRFALALWRRRPDIVYFTLPPTGGGFYACLPLVTLAKASGTRIVYHFHGKGIEAHAQRSGIYRRLMKWALKGSRVILLSPRLYDEVAPFAPREAVHFIPNGIPITAAPHHEGSTDDRPPQILYLSNLVLTKGPLVLLEALATLAARGANFRAVIAGAETSDLSAARLAEEIHIRGLERHVHYAGPVYGADKERLLAQSDIFAFPTYYRNEAFPITLLEAMSTGLAIVTTPEGAIPDFIRDGVNGILVPQQDPAALADALQRLLETPPSRTAMGLINRDTVLRDFTLDRFEGRMREVLIETLL
ncbi:MAG TPA: glycosyltransferase family 4 protein [Parvibaculum sp.]|uniref:glycosyltransferase family 4 protein n=1 Tax=Parvibaculum sp. TaxID=2024848 RepID=UPI002C2E5E5E|nr:glycosyltransferase family 4 protein [Parvibaculum sp.]HMM13375.1 glycosyltransferase family 4 protein [Parvibaculum sp.]